jgi:hypothetical protein
MIELANQLQNFFDYWFEEEGINISLIEPIRDYHLLEITSKRYESEFLLTVTNADVNIQFENLSLWIHRAGFPIRLWNRVSKEVFIILYTYLVERKNATGNTI